MSILICGSLAFDTIMVLDDKLKLAGSNTPPPPGSALDLYFFVPDLRREFGGCAGNIAYNLRLLNKTAYPMGTVGGDFGAYAAWLDNHGIPRDYIKVMEHSYTAQTYITQDMDDNKITAFHPGAMNFSHFNHVPLNGGIKLGVIAPDNQEGMLFHAREFSQTGTPFLFYPSHSIAQMLEDEVLEFIELATWMVLEEQDAKLLEKRLGLSVEQLAERVEGLIIGRGLQGAVVHADGVPYLIPAPRPKAMHDPSGCDDAFCAGLLYGLCNDVDWETTGRIASLMWAIKAEHHGTQSHRFTLERFKQLFKRIFGYELIA